MPTNTQQTEVMNPRETTPKTQAETSSKEPMKGSINFAKVTVTDTSSGEVVSRKRVILLANT